MNDKETCAILPKTRTQDALELLEDQFDLPAHPVQIPQRPHGQLSGRHVGDQDW